MDLAAVRFQHRGYTTHETAARQQIPQCSRTPRAPQSGTRRDVQSRLALAVHSRQGPVDVA